MSSRTQTHVLREGRQYEVDAVSTLTDEVDVDDTSTDPSANGEFRRNGSDVKVHSGGGVKNLSNIGSGGGGLSTTVIDDTDSPYTTQDEDVIYVDESNGAVTVTLASTDATQGNEIEVVSLTGTNTVTVNTESTETIDPNGESSKALDGQGWPVPFVSDGTNWAIGLAGTQAPLSIPESASASGADGSMAVGENASASNRSVVIGPGAGDQGDGRASVFGHDSSIGSGGVAVGQGAGANNSNDATAIGQGADPNNNNGVEMIGRSTSATAAECTVIGKGGSVATSNVCRIARSQLVFGGTQDTIADADLNNGELTVELDETNNAFRFRGKDSAGTVREATVAW